MPRKKKEPKQLSIEQIEEKLAQIDADKKALSLALKKRRAAELDAFVKELRKRIVEQGFTVEEILAVLSKGQRKSSNRRSPAAYVRYVDPDRPEHSYSRGPLPAWLREKMEAEGYDPADKAQREDFKSNYLRQVA
jgi:DNA-binding protein H-NS